MALLNTKHSSIMFKSEKESYVLRYRTVHKEQQVIYKNIQKFTFLNINIQNTLHH